MDMRECWLLSGNCFRRPLVNAVWCISSAASSMRSLGENAMLPLKSTFVVMRWRDLDAIRDQFLTFLYMGAALKRIGDGGVFECIYARAIDKPEVSAWFLRFFKGVLFFVFTNR